MDKNFARSFMSFFLMLVISLPLFAQGATDGTIAGTVQDAMIGGAKVIAKNNATGRTWVAQTGETGAFRRFE